MFKYSLNIFYLIQKIKKLKLNIKIYNRERDKKNNKNNDIII